MIMSGSQSMVSRAMSVTIDIAANITRARTAKATPGPANLVPRSPPSNATPVMITPTVATAAPNAWTVVSVSPRITTERTTVRPPYAATTPLTTEIGPTCRPVKYDR